MVIIDAPLPLQADGRSEFISSLDAGIVHQMFGDDLVLFQSLLSRLLKEYTDLTIPISVSPDEPTKRARLMGRTHKLKGSAGMIGATEIVRLAGAAESALHQGRPAATVEAILQRLASALTALSEEATPYLERQRELNAAKPPGPANGNADLAQLNDLCVLLEGQDLSALHKFQLISSALSGMLGAVRFDRLRDSIDNLDFQQAAQLLREAQLHRSTITSPAGAS
jgi:HPt (histidine-containing phosphotransfer) domain-containing protein